MEHSDRLLAHHFYACLAITGIGADGPYFANFTMATLQSLSCDEKHEMPAPTIRECFCLREKTQKQRRLRQAHGPRGAWRGSESTIRQTTPYMIPNSRGVFLLMCEYSRIRFCAYFHIQIFIPLHLQPVRGSYFTDVALRDPNPCIYMGNLDQSQRVSV